MWMCALCGRPTFAAACGALWVTVRCLYGFKYRMTKGTLKGILQFTIPSYLIVHILYFSTIQSILKVAFGFDDLKSNLSAAGVVLTAYLLTLGTAKLQRKQCEMWDKEQKKK
mmetsp:Transcript_13955/g.13726  ORF Transcript_13955/g.13726 Transcript_13955/m.13726 type:complete len:112 (-) Transcript_13955:106-441(-)